MSCMTRASTGLPAISTSIALIVLISIACGGGSKSPTAPSGNIDVVGSGVVSQRSIAVSGFTAVDHNGVGSLFIEQGAGEGLVITAEDNILPYLNAVVSAGTLRISMQSGVSLQTTRPIEYHLVAADLEEVELSGVGNIECDSLDSDDLALVTMGVGNLSFTGLDLDTLDVWLSGVGFARTSGSATRQNVILEGLDDYRGNGLASEVADVEIRGLGSATVRVSDRLVARVSGSGCVYYIGSPTVVAEITGSGCVEKIDD